MPVDSKRLELFKAIQDRRHSKILAYVTGDRTNRETQIAEDVVRLFYEHLSVLEPAKNLDLFLYTRGGIIFAPWRLVCLLREFTKSLAVLVPFKCHSAGTLMALGANEIIMTKMAELSPVDPQFVESKKKESKERPQSGRRSVEDVIAYIEFAKSKVGISEQAQLGTVLHKLSRDMSALDVGSIHRGYKLIRILVQELLSTHMAYNENEAKIKEISEFMTEKLCAHEYKIDRREAKKIGLNVKFDDDKLQELIWQLYLEYENLMALNDPWIPEKDLGNDQTKTVRQVRAALESETVSHQFISEVQLTRSAPRAQVNVQNLPPNVPPGFVEQIVQQVVQQVSPQGQQQVIPKVISEGWQKI